MPLRAWSASRRKRVAETNLRSAFDRAGAAAALLAAAVLAAGCADSGEQGRVNLSGFPPEFQQGYAEGCESASTRHTRRDESRYRSDEHYMRGWIDGYSVCRRR